MKLYVENTHALILSGVDVVDFLQRISTNDFRNFSNLNFIRTSFLNEKGRFVDFSIVYKFLKDIYLIPSSGNIQNLTVHFEKYIIMDDVNFMSAPLKLNYLIPENAIDIETLKPILSNPEFPVFEDLYRFRKFLIPDFGDKLNESLKDLQPISSNEFKVISYDNAFLYSSDEINDEINPLECMLKEFISFTKGCYIGQEVIARLDSQDKLPKVLVKVHSMSPITGNDIIYTSIDGKEVECGFITSSVQNGNAYTGFGFIRYISLNNSYNYYINKDINSIISIIKYNN